MKKPQILILIIAFILGGVIGGFLMSKTQKRSIFALNNCDNTCYSAKDIIGLFTSVGIQKLDSIIPNKITETDKTLVVENPFPEADIHYLVFPKKDIKDIAQLNSDDLMYIADAYKVMNNIILEKNLKNYRIITNGPGFQNTTYLHFHLRADIK